MVVVGREGVPKKRAAAGAVYLIMLAELPRLLRPAPRKQSMFSQAAISHPLGDLAEFFSGTGIPLSDKSTNHRSVLVSGNTIRPILTPARQPMHGCVLANARQRAALLGGVPASTGLTCHLASITCLHSSPHMAPHPISSYVPPAAGGTRAAAAAASSARDWSSPTQPTRLSRLAFVFSRAWRRRCSRTTSSI